MKAIAGLFVLLVLCGCAAAPPSAQTVDRDQIDTARMNAVEQAAARVGVRVYWINAPRKVAKPVNG